MKSIIFLCIYLSAWATASMGQAISIPPPMFNTLIPDFTKDYCYIGGGHLVAFRGDYIIGIGIKFDDITFNKTDSVLTIRGEIHDEAAYQTPLLTGVKLQILVGQFILDSVNNHETRIEVRKSIPLNQAPYFSEEIKIGNDDYLCFALNSDDNSGIPIGWVKLFNVGKLLE